ncbi:MAG: flavin reductase family protein [Promethearchaeota archaeon]|nr:MAG: flavin reductase family protein [Candidatus Lokiarchaeota archaeon]
MSNDRQEIGPYDYIEYFKRNTALLVSMDKNGKPNVMALDWKTIEEFEGFPVIRAQVAYSRYTYQLLTEGVNEFTVNIPLERNYEAINITGFYSGRNTDKFKKAGLDIIPGKKTKVPTIKDCILSYECQIVHSSKSNISSHHFFYGKILVAYASTDLIK